MNTEPTSRKNWHNLSLDFDTLAQIHIPETTDGPKILVDDNGRETLLYESGVTAEELASQLSDILLIEVLSRGQEKEHVSSNDEESIDHKDPVGLIKELCDIITSNNYTCVSLIDFNGGDSTWYMVDICQKKIQDNQVLEAACSCLVREIGRRESSISYTGHTTLNIHKPGTFGFDDAAEQARIMDETGNNAHIALFAYL